MGIEKFFKNMWSTVKSFCFDSEGGAIITGVIIGLIIVGLVFVISFAVCDC